MASSTTASLLSVIFSFVIIALIGFTYYRSQRPSSAPSTTHEATAISTTHEATSISTTHEATSMVPQSHIVESACPTGFTGQQTCSPTTCAKTDYFPATKVGETADAACPVGNTGMQSALCTSSGKFDPPNRSMCVELTCPKSGGFPVTVVGRTAESACPTGYTGLQTAVCQANGTFGSVDSGKCVPLSSSCLKTDVFPASAIGTTASAACPAGFTGTQTAVCQADGTFSRVDKTNCIPVPTRCAKWDVFPEAAVGTMVSSGCSPGSQGTKTGVCQGDGTWRIDDRCVRTYCPAISSFVTTPANSRAQGYDMSEKCPGQRRKIFRSCNMDGTWDSKIEYSCVPLEETTATRTCAASGIFKLTNAGVTAIVDTQKPGQCLRRRTALCQADGTFGSMTDECLDE